MNICKLFILLIVNILFTINVEKFGEEDKLAKTVYRSEGVLYLIQEIDYPTRKVIVKNMDNSTFVVLFPKDVSAKFKDKVYDFKKENLNRQALFKKYHFDPLAFNLEYGLVFFEIARQKGNVVEVYINSQKKDVKKIDMQSSILAKETWLQHIKRSEIAYNLSTNPLLSGIASGSKVPVPKSEFSEISWRVIKFSGMWAEIESFEGCNAAPSKKYKGWIRWTDGKKPLLTLFYDC